MFDVCCRRCLRSIGRKQINRHEEHATSQQIINEWAAGVLTRTRSLDAVAVWGRAAFGFSMLMTPEQPVDQTHQWSFTEAEPRRYPDVNPVGEQNNHRLWSRVRVRVTEGPPSCACWCLLAPVYAIRFEVRSSHDQEERMAKKRENDDRRH